MDHDTSILTKLNSRHRGTGVLGPRCVLICPVQMRRRIPTLIDIGRLVVWSA